MSTSDALLLHDPLTGHLARDCTYDEATSGYGQGILTRRVSYAQVSHSSRKVAHTVPHAHASEEVVSRAQGGWLGRRAVEVSQVWQ